MVVVVDTHTWGMVVVVVEQRGVSGRMVVVSGCMVVVVQCWVGKMAHTQQWHVV